MNFKMSELQFALQEQYALRKKKQYECKCNALLSTEIKTLLPRKYMYEVQDKRSFNSYTLFSGS